MSNYPPSLLDRLSADSASDLSLLPDPLPSARERVSRTLILAAPEAAERLRANLSIGSPKDTTAAALAILDRSPASAQHSPSGLQISLGADALQTLMSGLASFIGSAVIQRPSFRVVSSEETTAASASIPLLKELP